MKFIEEYVMSMEKHFFSLKNVYKWAKHVFATKNVGQNNSPWSENTLTLQ